MMSSPLAPILGVLGGCMGCMVFVEKIAKAEPSSMNLMTFSTFLFIACHGLMFTSRFLTVPNKIPLKGYIPTVITFFTVNVVNNQALNFHVPVPLHIIFRSILLMHSVAALLPPPSRVRSRHVELAIFDDTTVSLYGGGSLSGRWRIAVFPPPLQESHGRREQFSHEQL
ncbi:unnamed protein product [Heligmosomoides polygyrus]|uniref:Uncharacterized protein n=1 Tax=Heligmosomoides polygyrus TaxID=6339 RepID=A0A3P7XHF9_HELPZ|nr:unnamed protein product [Heligmosomoides polygyrus]